MRHLFLHKLLLPDTTHCIERPRLFTEFGASTLLAIGPSGAGKTLFLAQYLKSQSTAHLYYRLDEQDREGRIFATHLLTGFQRLWPDWSPPPDAVEEPAALIAELVNEAISRPPVTLVLDQLEQAFEQPYLTEVLSILVRYAPPSLTLAIGSRSPPPVQLERPGVPVRLVTTVMLAFSADEARTWLGEGEWQPCLAISGGLPLALRLWQQHPTDWQTALSRHLLANIPPHLSPEVGRPMVQQWLSGQQSLADFAYQFSEGRPGTERLWREVQQSRSLMLAGAVTEAEAGLRPLWERALATGDQPLGGVVALLLGECHYCWGEYAQAMAWYREAFSQDPSLELTGCHNVISILRDQGHLDEAKSLGLRCLEALQSHADLNALASAHFQYATVALQLEQLDEADLHFQEAERIGLDLAAEPFYGILALSQRAQVHVKRGNLADYRRVTERAYALARRRSPWLEAICAYSLAPGMLAWGEADRGRQLLEAATQFLTGMDAKFQLHMIHTIWARMAWAADQREEARRHFDRALTLGALEEYVQYIPGPGDWLLDLLVDAMVRCHELPFCQRLLLRMGARAMPVLTDLAQRSEPGARRAALYPLATLGGDEAIRIVEALLDDPDESVSDQAVVAYKALVGPNRPTTREAPARSRETTKRLQLSLLGVPGVSFEGEVLPGWRTAKARDLLVYLVIAGDRLLTRSQIIDALWPEAEFEAGQRLLHTTLYHLRRTIKPAGEGVVTFAGGAYKLNRNLIDVDLDRFYSLAASETPADLQSAVQLYHGEPLEGLDYPWCIPMRNRARSAYIEVLRNLANHHRKGGHLGRAAECLQLLLQVDPLHEDGHIDLMRCFIEAGNRHAALQQYQTLAHLLDEELGLEPSAPARELYRQLLD